MKLPRSLPVLLAFCAAVHAAERQSEYSEFNDGQDRGGENWIQAIQVTEPAYRAEVRGNVIVKFSAPGMTSARALCWQQPTAANPDPWGHDEPVGPQPLALDAQGRGSFVFPADRFPNGPINLRLFARDEAGRQDVCELQLFNLGGVPWNQGIPKSDPPAARGMKLVFADDFDQPLSISNDGRGTVYHAHKPRFGDFSGWPFSDVLGPGKPFGQTGTWLKIAARKDAESPKGRTGLIASVDADGKGLWAKAPCYLECRFIAQSAIGTWPAFWTITHLDPGTQGDELDIVEAYGGMGKGNPNHPGYSVVGHFWGQDEADGTPKKHPDKVVRMLELGGRSYWSTTFHTYGCRVGLDDTIYYLDDIEVFRHPTGEVSKKFPHAFLINYAIGGISGWKIDLSRYAEGSDMWVDYVRVFAEQAVPDYVMGPPGATPGLAGEGIGLNFSVAGDASTELAPDEVAGAPEVSQAHWNNLPGASGTLATAIDQAGRSTPLKATWGVPAGDQAWRSKTGRDWGFKNADWKLQKGYIQLGGRLEIRDIPYKSYDVQVYLGADDKQGAGKIVLTPPAAAGPPLEQRYALGWLDGRFVRAAPPKASNRVVFPDQRASSIVLEWTADDGGGWTGVTGIQIISK